MRRPSENEILLMSASLLKNDLRKEIRRKDSPRRAAARRQIREAPNIRRRACQMSCPKGQKSPRENKESGKTVHNLINSVIDYSNYCCEVTVCFAIKPLTGGNY